MSGRQYLLLGRAGRLSFAAATGPLLAKPLQLSRWFFDL